MKRLTIYPKDIQIITGRSERYSRKLLEKMRAHFNRNKDGLITIQEFCSYTGLNHEEVEKRIL
jgi:hypothetical protein